MLRLGTNSLRADIHTNQTVKTKLRNIVYLKRNGRLQIVFLSKVIYVIDVLVNAMHSGRTPYRWDFQNKLRI